MTRKSQTTYPETLYSSAFSWLEHMTVNHGVPGSSPGEGAD